MATIVYDGGGDGGTLFEGIKFCFLQRVPSRQRWIELAKSNGGEIVPLEKQADIVIADHARKECPTGSISWTYIQDSVKNGELEDIENHRAGPAAYVAREVGSGGPTRKGRTPFTAEDDRILKLWVAQGIKAGSSERGNELFKQLEEKNSRHTFQSWRDRWIKYVQHQPQPEIPDRSPPPSAPGRVAKTKATIATHRARPGSISSQSPELRRDKLQAHRGTASSSVRLTKKISGESVASSNFEGTRISEPSTAKPRVATSSRGMDFTKKEIQLLIDIYDDIMNIDEDQALDAWAAWSEAHPDHTPQEWRNYFVKQLAPQIEQKRRSELQQAQVSQKTRPSKQLEKQPTPAPDLVPAEVETTDSQPATQIDIDPVTEDEQLFEATLLSVAAGFEIELGTFHPVIHGRKISLFKLYQVVKTEFGGGDEVTGRHLWPKIARKFNFDDDLIEKAGEDLKACYDEILVDYEGSRDAFSGMTESQAEALAASQTSNTAASERGVTEEDEVLEEQDEEDFDDDLEAPLASSPSKSSRKRSNTGLSNHSLSSLAGSYSKRQRIDKGKGKELEIPSTPEEVFNNNQMPQKAYQPSPLKLATKQDEGSEEEILKPFMKPAELLLSVQQLMAEPETQDFQFPFQTDEEAENEADEGWVAESPSRQAGARRAQSLSRSRIQERDEVPEALQTFIDYHVSLGYTQDHVLEALESTTLNTANASFVMESLTVGRGIPEDYEGVWTAWDDAALDDEYSADFQFITAKHGMKRVRERQRFLKDRREVRLERRGHVSESWIHLSE